MIREKLILKYFDLDNIFMWRFFGIGLLAISTSANAWVSLGEDLYIEPSSQARRGDTGTLLSRYTKGGDFQFVIEFDCKLKKVLKPPQWAGPISDSPSIEKAYALACKEQTWYEKLKSL